MEVVLFGAGKIGKYVLGHTAHEVVAVIDNNPEIQGQYLGQKYEDVDREKLDWSYISLEDVKKGTEYPKRTEA